MINRTLTMTIICLCALVGISMYRDSTFGILTQKDIALEKNQDTPALRSPIGELPKLESYNQWQCFPVKEIDVLCVDECDDGDCLKHMHKAPLLSILHEDHLYEFTDDSAPSEQCISEIEEWKKLYEGETGVCVYAAFLQKVEVDPADSFKGRSDWVLSNLKTQRGVWRTDYLPYAQNVGSLESEK